MTGVSASDPLMDFARRAKARLVAWGRHAGTFGSAGSMVLAALLGVAAFGFALASPSMPTAEAAPSPPPALRGRLTEVSAQGAAPAEMTPAVLAPIGAPPAAAIETALDYDVVFFWPTRPQTVADPVAIRSGPASYAQVIRSARPGERLRINGRVDDAPNGPWLRVRLADGKDGYFAARTIDVGAWRQRRKAEAVDVVEAAQAAEAAGAPLMASPPGEYTEPEIGPPSF